MLGVKTGNIAISITSSTTHWLSTHQPIHCCKNIKHWTTATTDTVTQTQTDRQTDEQTETDRQRQTDRHRQTDRQTDRVQRPESTYCCSQFNTVQQQLTTSTF